MTDIDAMADLIVRTIRTRGRQVDVTAESAIRDAMRALVPATLQRRDAMPTIPEETLAHWERERARQRATDTAPAELVTEEMVDVAAAAFENSDATHDGTLDDGLRVALRAVAPLIAARARMAANEASFPEAQRLVSKAVAAEREACAKIMDELEDRWAREWRAGHKADKHLEGKSDGAGEGAAAIRARGEKP